MVLVTHLQHTVAVPGVRNSVFNGRHIRIVKDQKILQAIAPPKQQWLEVLLKP